METLGDRHTPSAGPGETTSVTGASVSLSSRVDAGPGTPINNALATSGEDSKKVEQEFKFRPLAGAATILKSAGTILSDGGSRIATLANKVSDFVSTKFSQATSTTDFNQFKANVLEHLEDKKNENLKANNEKGVATFHALLEKVATSDSKSDIENALKSAGYKLPSVTREVSKTTLSDRLDDAKETVSKHVDTAKEAFQELKATGQRRLNQNLPEDKKIGQSFLTEETQSLTNSSRQQTGFMDILKNLKLIQLPIGKKP